MVSIINKVHQDISKVQISYKKTNVFTYFKNKLLNKMTTNKTALPCLSIVYREIVQFEGFVMATDANSVIDEANSPLH